MIIKMIIENGSKKEFVYKPIYINLTSIKFTKNRAVHEHTLCVYIYFSRVTL